ncbi:hypothetical protein EN829_021125 [Mesorhizobium sp. M00.F.Ca.ET.186.01.1.1]|nr:hypothetical protein EN848_28230 [bacterium M00.F.Ca.ET.205.01.1.1]TGU50511.1 hypothetical protein EN795_23170 [bacterium M00.F.Ca.ET.152.01.1.1]TGV33974.1 hypothetical protein EN829_021125 [Mesorhizobium sp. M00.F.Ca.ET.186.01.1.1]TGZ40875.1 hypothetical protein EN805_22565 [bacterium M00.F.Ca.ET.162.01.1.1]
MAAADFAHACGYDGDSPALIEAFEAIRDHGIRQARQDHLKRKAAIDSLKQSEILFLAAIGPALSAEEAIADASHFIAFWRNMPRWRQERRLADLARAKQQRLLARFFRRYGQLLWARQAA